MEIISRQEAKELNLKYYFTGKPCKRGHISKRFVYGHCTLCVNTKSREWSAKNREKSKQIKLKWIKNNPKKDKKSHKKWLENNKEKILNYQKNWQKENKEYRTKYISRWRKRNPEKEKVYRKNRLTAYKIHSANRRAAKLQRTMTWTNFEKIEEIYKNCPKGMVVDHIVPLQGKNVSGLHVENNLQYLTRPENSRKNNKFEVKHTMIIRVTIQDIQTSKDPIGHAILRQHGKEAHTDRKYIIFYGNERFPRRLPLSAEDFNYRLHTGEVVQPFSFEL